MGLPDTALREARDQIRSAVINSGHDWPMRRITVGSSPVSDAAKRAVASTWASRLRPGAGFGRAVVPVQNAAEAPLVPSVQVISAPAFPPACQGRPFAAAV